MVARLTSQQDASWTSSASSAIGRFCRRLLSWALVAAVFCSAVHWLPTFAQPPVLSPPATQFPQKEKLTARSSIQAPTPQYSGGHSLGRQAVSVYPKIFVPRGYSATTIATPSAPPPYPTQPPAEDPTPVHVYPKSIKFQDPDLAVSAPQLRTAPRLVLENMNQHAGTGFAGGHDFQDDGPSSTAETHVPLHVYPDGVTLHDEVDSQRSRPLASVKLQVPAQFVGTQEVFGPPPGIPDVAMPGGHSEFFDSNPPVLLPVIDVAPDIMEIPGMLQSPTQVEDDGLLWWEADLSENILRGRPTHSLTLPQALGLALTEAPELQVLHSEWFMQQIEINRQDAVFDWATFVNTIWNRDSTPVGSLLDGATNRLRSRTLNAAAGMRRLNRDGSEFEVSQSIGTRSSNSTLITPNYQGNSRLAFEYEKPLLQGAGEDYNTSRVQLAELDKDTAFDRFQIGVQDHLLEVASTYWTLVLRRGRFVQSVNSWNRAKEIEREMASRVEVDVTPSMLDRTRTEVATRLASSIQAEHDVFSAQEALLRLIYGSKYARYASHEVVTVTLPMKDGTQVTPESQIETALQSRSEIHQAIRQIKSASVRYNVAANEVLPVLDMVLTGYVAGLDGDYDIASAFGDQFTEAEPGVGVGFNFEIPYRNRAAEATAEQGMVAIKRMRAELETTIGEVTQNVRGQVIERNKYGSVLPQRWESLARTRRVLNHTQVRREFLADGVQVADLYLENLLSMQSRLENAEFTYLESQVRFSLADTALLRAISQLDTIAERGVVCSPPGSILADTPQLAGEGVRNADLAVEEFTHPSQVTAASASRVQQ